MQKRVSVLFILLVFLFSAKVQARQCLSVFANAEKHFELAKTLAQKGESLMKMDRYQKADILMQMHPEGYLLHGTSIEVVKQAIRDGGVFVGSKNIHKKYWGRSRDLQGEKIPTQPRTLYFFDTARGTRPSADHRDVESYAGTTGTAYYVLKELKLTLSEYASTLIHMDHLVRDGYDDVAHYIAFNRKYLDRKTIQLLKNMPPLESTIYEQGPLRKGVVLVFNRDVFKRLKSYVDPETGAQFFLLNEKNELRLDDLIMIIPMTEHDLKDLNDF